MSRVAVLLGLTLSLVVPSRAQTPPASPAPAAAATDAPPAADLPVAVEVTLGFQNRIPTDGFLHVAVDLANRGASTNAIVVIRAQEAGNVLLRLGPVELEGGARRRLIGVVPAKPVVEGGTLIVSALTAPGEDTLLGQAAVSPETAPARLLVALDRRGGAPSDLSSLRTMDGAGPGGQPQEVRWTTVIVSRLEDLPQNPLAYSGAGAVLLGDLDLEGWPEPEARALAAWVARGGHLVLSVGPRARLLRGRSLVGRFLGPALKALPDAPPDRDVPLDDIVEGLRGAYGLDPADGGAAAAPALASLLPGPDDDVLLRAGERPFVVRRRHGLGLVTLVGADLWAPPFLHSPVTTRLLEALLVDGPVHVPRSRLLFRDLSGVRQPARVGPAFAGLILYALIAGPGIYFVLRGKKRGILLWVVIPAITLAFTAAVPLYRVFLRDAESTIVGIRLVEGWAGQALTVETTDVLLFSGSLEPKRFDYGGEDAVAFAVIPPRRRGGADVGALLGAGPAGTSFSLPVALWGTRYLSFEAGGQAAAASGGVSVSLRVADATTPARPQAHVRLRWDGPTLRDAFVIYPSMTGPAIAHRLDDLAPGAVVDVPATGISAQSIDARESDLAAMVVESLLQSRYRAAVEQERTAFLIGISDQNPPVRVLPNVRTRAFGSIYVFQLPVTYEDAVPFGVARQAREGSTIAAVGSGAIEREVRTRLALPSPGGREAGSIRLRVAAQRVRSLLRLRLDAFDWREERWVTLLPRDEGEEEREGQTRRIELPLEEPARFVSRDGLLLLRQRFTRQRQDTDEAHVASLEVAVEWARGP